MIYVWFLIGLIIIVKSSDLFLDSAIWIARTFKVPEVVVGATIVSICTVLPETIISVSASINKNAGLAYGNSIGSIVCNVAVILAIGILVHPSKLNNVDKLRKNIFVLLGLLMAMICAFFFQGYISRWYGVALLGVLCWYLWENSRTAISSGTVVVKRGNLCLWLLLLVLGAAGIALGSHILVDNGEKIALSLGVPPLIIGITLTALGSSLPELVTCIASISKGAADISIGNIIGANILNACLVIASSAIVNPIILNTQTAIFHAAAGIVFALYLLQCFFRKSRQMKRLDGFLLLLLYGAYLWLSMTFFALPT